MKSEQGGETNCLIAATDQASNRIIVFDPDEPDWSSDRAVVWTWAPSEANGFASLVAAWGKPTDAKVRDCAAWGGQWMVVTDSRGLAAIIPYPAGDSRKWGLNVGGNPHSAELLPDGNIAVAASTGGWVRLYASSQGPDSGYYAEYRFAGAHGLVWDPDRQLLWAVGDDELVALQVSGTAAEPQLAAVRRTKLPATHGHDLQPVLGDADRLWVSTGSSVYIYVKSHDTFETDFPGHEQISRGGVKSVGNQPCGQVVQTVPLPAGSSLYEWTTDTVALFRPEGRRVRAGAAFYKARILIPGYGQRRRSDPAQWKVGTSYRLETAKDIDADLAAMRQAGLSYVEIAWRNELFDMFDPERERQCESLIERARALGLDIWTLHLPYGTPWDVSSVGAQEREAAVARHVRLLQLAARWRIGTVVLHPSWEPIAPAERPARLAACKLGLAALAAEAAPLGIRVAVECLPRTCLGNTSAEMAELLTASDKLGICCDVNHLVQEPPEAFIGKLGSRIFTVHMSDNDGTDEKHWMPGTGIIRWSAVIEQLAAYGYEGPYVFEVRKFVAAELMSCWQGLLAQYRHQTASAVEFRQRKM